MISLIGNILCVYCALNRLKIVIFLISQYKSNGLPRNYLFFDHRALKLVIQIYEFIVHYLTNSYTQVCLFPLHFDSDLKIEGNPLADMITCQNH